MGNATSLFDYKYSEKPFDRLEKMRAKVGTDWVKLIIFEGKHEFCKNDEPMKRLIENLL